MRQENKNDSDMGHAHFLNSTCDMEENKRQRHVTLPFLKIDMRHGEFPSRAPIHSQPCVHHCSMCLQTGSQVGGVGEVSKRC